MIRILSGWSNPGGSTTAFINLTNALNEAGYETVFHGPHPWHLDKCKAEHYFSGQKMRLDKEDILLTHFKPLQNRPPVKKVILVCHEKWWFKVGQISKHWDTAVFLHEEHYKYHVKNGFSGEYCIIPNLREHFVSRDKKSLDKIAGIIGSIEDRKKTHLSIQRALKDGCEKIYLFGNIGDQNYFQFYIKTLLNDKIELKGFVDNKQLMYDMIGRVYHSSIGEVASLVKDECYETGTKFFGSAETNNDISVLTNEEIIKSWIKLIEE